MRHRITLTRILALIIGVAACADKALAPGMHAGQLVTLKLSTTFAAQTTPSLFVDVRVTYVRASGGSIQLLQRDVPVTGAEQDVSLSIDIAPCLADADRSGDLGTCMLHIDVVLRDVTRAGLDSVQLPPVAATAGGSVTPITVNLASGRATTIATQSGSGQSAPAGALLPQPLVVHVTASDGRSVSGTQVAFAVATGGGSVGSPTAVTNAAGLAQTTWRLGGTPGVQAVTASVNGLAGSPVTFTATALAAGPSHLALTTAPAGASSGTAFTTQPVVEVRDAQGIVVTSSSAVVTAAISSGSGTLAGVITVSAVNGVATFSDLRITGAGPHTLTFTSPALSSTTSPIFNVTQVATALAIVTQPGGANSGVNFSSQPVVSVTDASGGVVGGSAALVTAAIASGTGTLSGTTTVAAAGGVATFTNLRITGAGAYTLVFSSPGLTSVTSANIILGQVATQLAITTQPAGAASGANFTTQPVVAVRDVSANLVPGSTASITAAIASGTGTLSGTTTVVAVNGVATFTNLRITGTGAHTLTFTSAGLTGATSAGFTVVQTATVLAISTQPGGANSGVNFTTQPVIHIHDAIGAIVTGSSASVTAAIASGSGTLSGTTTVVAVAGVATFADLRITGTGTHTLVFTSPGLTSVTSANIIPGQVATQLGITTQPGGAANGVDFTTQPIVQVRDASNNLVPTSTASVTAALASGSGTLSGTTTVAAVNGVATFANLRITGTGAHTLTFSSGGLTAATSSSFNVAQVATQLAVTTQPAGAVSGADFTTQPVIQVRDGSNALVITSTASVTASITSGSGTLSGTTTVSASGGVATFTNLRITGSGAHTLSFASSGLTGASSSSFTVTQVATQLAFSTQPSTVSTGATMSPAVQVQARDAGGALVTSFTGNITVALGANPGGSVLGGTLTVAAVAGVATFSNLTLNNAATGYTMTANASGLTGATSSTFDVTAGGTTNSWTNAAGGNWSTPGNWSLGHVPLSNETVNITLAGTYTVSLDVTASVTNLTIGGASGTQTFSDINGVTLSLSGTMTITSAGVVSLAGTTVSGAGSISNAGSFTVTSGTVNVAFANQGLLTFRGTCALNGALTTTASSVIRFDGFNGFETVVANGFTNNGLIELNPAVGSSYAQLTVTTGTLINAPGATISALAGAGGTTRSLLTELDNRGTLSVGGVNLQLFRTSTAHHTNSGTINISGGNLLLSHSGTAPDFTNTGTITIGSGRTLDVNGGAFTQSVGATLNGGGALSLTNVITTINTSFTLSAISILQGSNATFSTALSNAAMTWVTEGTISAPSFTNATGKTQVLINATINAPLTNQGVLILRAFSALNGAVTSVVGSTIRVDGTAANGPATATIASGFTNNGAIELTSIAGGSQSADLTVSSGTLVNAPGATIDIQPGGGGFRFMTLSTFNNQGTLSVGMEMQLTHTSTVFTNSGTITVSGGDLNLNQFGTGQSFTNTGTVTVNPGRTLNVNGGTFTHEAAATLAGGGALTFSPGSTAAFNASFTLASIALTGTGATFATAQSNASMTWTIGGGTTINAPGFTNATGKTQLILSATMNAPLTNQGTLIIHGTSTFNGALTTAIGSTIRVEGADFSFAHLQVASSFTNAATIELTTIGTGTFAQVTMLSGSTLTNAVGASISVLAGVGGGRSIQGILNNQGTLDVTPGSASTLLLGTLINSGAINMEIGGLTAGTLHDQITVDQTATLGGTLNVTLINGFTPLSSQSFTLLTSSGATSGTFTTTNLPPTLVIAYQANSFTVNKP